MKGTGCAVGLTLTKHFSTGMDRRRVFTVDLALQAILDEDDDFLFGEAFESSEDSGSDDDTAHPPQLIDSSASGDDSDSGKHFLDRDVDTRSCAARFARNMESSESKPDGADGGEGASGGNAHGGSSTQEARLVCGCSKQCLKFFRYFAA